MRLYHLAIIKETPTNFPQKHITKEHRPNPKSEPTERIMKMNKLEKKQFKELKRKEKKGELSLEEIKELTKLYRKSTFDYMKLTIVCQGIALCLLALALVMRFV